jgi:hypothetical protein
VTDVQIIWAAASSLPRIVTRHHEHRADLVADLPAGHGLGRKRLLAALIVTGIDGARRAGDDQQRHTGPKPHIAGFESRHDGGDGGAKRAGKQRTRILEK